MRTWTFLLAMALLLALMVSPGTAQAATFTVDSTDDVVDANPGDGVCDDGAGNCTLRAAIMETNALAGSDAINLPAGTYTLTLGSQLSISKDLTLTGTGADNTIVQATTGPDVASFRVFNITSGAVNISDLTIRNGKVTSIFCNAGCGGGIFNSGTLTLTNSTVSGNTGGGGGGGIGNWFGTLALVNSTVIGNSALEVGGGILNTGTLTLTNSTVSGNAAGTDGGGIWNRGTLILSNSTVSGNMASSSFRRPTFGGGIWNASRGTLTLAISTVSGNTAPGGGGIFNDASATIADSNISGNIATIRGGGIFNNTSGRIAITDSTIRENTAANLGGGIFNDGNGELTLTNITITGNTTGDDGGGISISAADGASLTLTNSTINDNTAGDSGGGIDSGGPGNITNSTISGNTANFGGGIRHFNGAMNLTNTTISGNTAGTSGGGIFRTGIGTVSIKNTIVANNVPGDCFADPVNSLGHNLDSDGTCNLNAAGDKSNSQNANLGPLQNNGGPTETHALLPFSAAIDMGDPTGCKDPDGIVLTTDQRGVARHKGPACDIGAYELAVINEPPTADAGPDQTGELTADGSVVTLDGSGSSDPDGDPLTFTWTGPFSEGGGTVTGVSPTVTLASLGLHTISLTVDDGKGGTDTDTVTINVVPGAAPPPDNAPPTCEQTMWSFTVGDAGAFRVQDTGSGIAAINLLPSSFGVTLQNHSGDAGKTWPVGTTDPVDVLFVVDATTFFVEIEIIDLAGNVTTCVDPVVLVVREKGKPVSLTVSDLGHNLSTVTVMNGDPGVKNLAIVVNGEKFKVAGLGDNEETTIDISSAMVDGRNNTITLTAFGKPGARAVVLIWDGGA